MLRVRVEFMSVPTQQDTGAYDLRKDTYEKRKPGRPKGATTWKRVEVAREMLARQALGFVRDVRTASKIAAQAGDSRPAQWALEHLAWKDDAGVEVRPIAPGADRPAAGNIGNGGGPVIQIGFALGGVSLPVAVSPKALADVTAQVIDTTAHSQENTADKQETSQP